MESLSPAIGSQTIRPSTTVSSENELLIGSVKSIKLPALACRKMRMRVAAQASNVVVSNNIDFSDPDWKVKYQREFEARFNLPHITDVFPDSVSYPSTFCLKMRTPISEDFAQGYPSDEEWHGYINNNDRVLLKTINYSSPTSAGAECIDPDCTWVEQWVHRAGPRENVFQTRGGESSNCNLWWTMPRS